MQNRSIMQERVKNIHFVGIGGAGMCGIAEVLANQGYTVSGSDIKASAVTERLVGLGVQVFIGHDSKNIQNADVVVVSSAIDKTNPEIQTALRSSEYNHTHHRLSCSLLPTGGKPPKWSAFFDFFSFQQISSSFIHSEGRYVRIRLSSSSYSAAESPSVSSFAKAIQRRALSISRNSQ